MKHVLIFSPHYDVHSSMRSEFQYHEEALLTGKAGPPVFYWDSGTDSPFFFTFIISLFTDRVGIYHVHNSGSLYNLGYLLDVMIFFGGSGKGAGHKRK